MISLMDITEFIDTWRRILSEIAISDEKSWVLFSHDTCVVLPEPPPGAELGGDLGGDLGEQAVSLLAEHGPVHIGTPSGDFNVVRLDRAPGWCVTCHHPAVLTHVAPTDVTAGAGDLEVGLCGRSKRHMDGTELKITHIEDRRTVSARTGAS
jgi:hypothetical protein